MPRPAQLPIAARRHAFIATLEHGLRARCCWAGTGRIVAGVSGGPDSMALLAGMCVLAARERGREAGAGSPFEVLAVHVNHHLRPEADADAAWVRKTCERLGVNSRVVDVHPDVGSGNVAAMARELRYAALAQAARQFGASAIVVGHHADDQLETMLMALCRGAGLDGLRGMSWRRRVDAVDLLRPLLGVTKADCESFCAAAGIEWLVDPSNLRTDKARSRLRRDVVPILEELWPGAAERTVGTGYVLEAAASLLNERVAQGFGEARVQSWPRRVLRDEPAAIVAAGLRRAALALRAGVADELGQKQLLDAAEVICSAETSTKRFDWPCELRLCVDAHRVELRLEHE